MKKLSLLSCVKVNNDFVEPLGNAGVVSKGVSPVLKLLVEKVIELWDEEVKEETAAMLCVSGIVDRDSA